MAMSSLGAQLSALSSTNKAASGFAHSSSRANNDAIGRGFGYSNKHGHAISTGDNVTRRASILYDNAREAAEVPLVTLRENALAALEQLSDSTAPSSESLWKSPEFIGSSNGLLSTQNLNNFERGTSTSAQNVQIDKSIGNLLKLLMTMVAECPPPTDAKEGGSDVNSNPILLSCLHIVEYLLRRYEINTRAQTASLLLQTFLPLQVIYPTSYPQLFSRLLSLVDLQSVPEYTFLRPFAAQGAPPLVRGILAKRVAKDDALAAIVAKMAKGGNEICAKEGALAREREMQIDGEANERSSGDSKNKALPVRRGISALLSFSASILVEGLHIQSTSKDAGYTGGVQESIVRVLLPLILSACKAGSGDSSEYYCPEWKEWGRLLASTLSMLCPLNVDVKTAFCDAIVDGLPGVKGMDKKKSFQDAVDSVGDNVPLSIKEVDDANSGIMTLISVLGAMSSDKSKNDSDDENEGLENYLPMLPPVKKRRGTIIDYMGCELPVSTYKKLTKSDASLAMALGAVLQSLISDEDDEDEGIMENPIIMERIAPLVASIIMRAFRRLETEAGKVLSSSSATPKKKRKSKGGTGKEIEEEIIKCKADRDVLLILNLIQDPSLLSLWSSKASALVAAVTVQAIHSYDNVYLSVDSKIIENQSSSMVLNRYTTILKGLSGLNSAVHDQGVAYAINTIAKKTDKESTNKQSKESQMSRLAKLLGRGDASTLASSTKSKKGKGASADRGASNLLPPRVALESAEASVRLDAINQLKASLDKEDEVDEDLGYSLLRRMVTDDDPAVAAAAGEIVAKQLKDLVGRDEDEMDISGSNAFSSLVDDLDLLAKEALAALSKWTVISKDDSWSPVSSSETEKSKKTKNKSKKSKGKIGSSPLLSCISICGSVAKLIVDQESIEDMFEDVGDLDQITQLFCLLFLGLGAHLSYTDEVSKASSAELAQLTYDENESASELITSHPISHHVQNYFFGAKAEGSHLTTPKLLKERFLWFALHSYAEHSDEMSSDYAQVVLDLVLHQMQYYTQESMGSTTFQWEAQFLCDLCKAYLLSFSTDDRDQIGQAIVNLASTKSGVSFDEIVKPAIESCGGIDVTILLYACLQPNTSKAGVLRTLDIAQSLMKDKSVDSLVARASIIPTFALLSHPERKTRECVISLLEQFQSVKDDEIVSNICSQVIDKSSPIRSSLVMDGTSTLPQMLSQIVLSSSSPAPIQEFLISCNKSCALKENGTFSRGGCQASTIILSAMEKAGENVFSLSKRWEFAGKDLIQAFLSYEHNDIGPLRDCVLSMLKGVLVHEAQANDDGVSIQIALGPSKSGRRTRSYSIGASDSFSTLQPYPESMLDAILEALSSTTPLQLSKHVLQLVVVRQSWANGVFPKLDRHSRHKVASALLALRTQDDIELAGSSLAGLPLKSSDFIQLLKDVDASKSEVDQSAVVFITDCLRGKLEVLGSTDVSNVVKLSSRLFDQLQLLSSVQDSKGDSGGRDYTRVAILQTLFAIHSHYKSELSKPLEENTRKLSASKRRRSRSHSDVGTQRSLASQADLLVGLVGGNPSDIQPLNSGRGRALSLSLLTCLCEESPSTVVTSLLPALMSLVGASSDLAVRDALAAVVPSYCAHAFSAKLSLFSLLENFVGKIIGKENEKMKYNLLDHLVDALKLLPTKETSSDAIASLAACVMALQAFDLQEPTTESDADSEMADSEEKAPNSRLDTRVLANTTSRVKIAVALSLLQYAEKLMSYVCGLSELSSEASIGKMKVDISEVTILALHGTNGDNSSNSTAYSNLSESQQRSILYLAINLLQSVRDTLSTQTARRVVRKSRGEDADLCLRMWNELMQTHSNTLRAHAKLVDGQAMTSMEKRFWDAAPVATSECLENLQNSLPVPHFLASVSSALTDDASDTYIRKKSMKLLADRVVEVNCDSPEASLFLEMVPNLVELISTETEESDDEGSLANIRRRIVMKQGALIAIESFVRSLYPPTEKGKLAANAAAVFLPALACVTKLLDHTALSWIEANGKDAASLSSGVVDAECQLLSSSALCLSTLVTTLKARCLPQLPSIIKPLVKALQAINSMLGKPDDQAAITGELLQVSILKTLQSIAETLPQFLLQYLPVLFSNDALPSRALHQGSSEGANSVQVAVKQVETTLATKVQIRQLIPALSQALSKNLHPDNSENLEEACSIINVMNIAVESSQRSQLSPIIGKIFNGLVMAFGYVEGDESSRSKMLQSANKCLLSLVMKLSEAQLRPLYARLREWRGDIDEEGDGQVSSIRRYAFWSLSAELSKSLRSIFLPCLTSVLTDVIDELEIAVSLLCQRSKKADGSKKRRVEETDGSVEDLDNKIKPLQPLLLCLESALKADAHEGGDWTRGDDNQRYNMILSHLGKLLMAQVPKELALVSDIAPKGQASTSSYQQLIQGVGTADYGNVVGCLTSLAAAAGNEQLWKPLNFAVLEACGHKRSEVRKAGISCLLSIIETIGEEYMVLLPECLPVLSELLEDDDEIAGMAKECVRQGEELLGESLEDSLR